MSTQPPGRVITFYSYKGGTGRTMALANVACLLARRGAGKVLMIDWDLEAPGLHRFFADMLVDRLGKPWSDRDDEQPGLIDLFRDLDRQIGDGEQDEDEGDQLLGSLDLDQYLLRCSVPSLYLLKAGRFDDEYSTSVNTFLWDRLYARSPWLFKSFAERLMGRFAYVLVDARTGLTDSSGICTMLLPEKLVVVFTPNTQSLTGIVQLIRRATAYRAESDDLRPLVVFPLASRIELSEEELRRQWRYGGAAGVAEGYQTQFQATLKEAYDLPQCRLEEYFDEVQIQYVTHYAYGEKIAVLSEPTGDRLSLSRSYAGFVDWLADRSAPWEPLRASMAPTTMVNLSTSATPAHFVDRQRECDRLRELIANESVRVVSVIGRPGIGKSALVSKTLDTLVRRAEPLDGDSAYLDGIVYMNARSRPFSARDVLMNVARLLPNDALSGKSALFENQRMPIRRVLEFLLDEFPADYRVAVVIDDLDELIDPITQELEDKELQTALKDLLELPVIGATVILTTSIPPRSLALSHLARYKVFNLETGLPQEAAIELLQELDADGSVGLASAPVELLEKAHALTGGHPRALEALYTILLTDRTISLAELLSGSEPLPPDRVVEVLIGEAFSRLDPLAQRVAEALAIYRTPVDPAAVEYLLRPYMEEVNARATLGRLVSMNLAHKDGERYRLASLDREYVLRLIPAGNPGDAHREDPPPFTRHALLHRGAEFFVQARVPEKAVERIDDLYAERMEIDLRIRNQEYEAAARVALSISWRYLLLWGSGRVVVDLHEELEGKLTDPELDQANLWTLGDAHGQLGQTQQALSYYERALALSKEIGDHLGQKRLMTNIGSHYYQLGQLRQAIGSYGQALKMAREQGLPVEEAAPLSGMSLCYSELGDFTRAIDHNLAALRWARESDDPYLEAEQLANQGYLYSQLGDLHRATKSLDAALAISRRVGHRLLEGHCLCERADTLIDQVRPLEAISVAAEAIAVGERIGSSELLHRAHSTQALSLLSVGELERARIAVDTASGHSDELRAHNTSALQGIIAVRQDDHPSALEAFGRALGQADRILADREPSFAALDTRGLALSGLLLLGRPTLGNPVDAYRAARSITTASGVVARAVLLLDALAAADSKGQLVQARAAAARAPDDSAQQPRPE